MASEEPVEPLADVSDQSIYWFLHFTREPGSSWWDACRQIEASLIETGWTPPPGYKPAAPGKIEP
jgi:hypothetical protein